MKDELVEKDGRSCCCKQLLNDSITHWFNDSISHSLNHSIPRVHVPAGEDYADALSCYLWQMFEEGRDGDRARRLDDDLHPLPDEMHRFQDRLFGDTDDRGDILRDDLEVVQSQWCS